VAGPSRPKGWGREALGALTGESPSTVAVFTDLNVVGHASCAHNALTLFGD